MWAGRRGRQFFGREWCQGTSRSAQAHHLPNPDQQKMLKRSEKSDKRRQKA